MQIFNNYIILKISVMCCFGSKLIGGGDVIVGDFVGVTGVGTLSTPTAIVMIAHAG
jgi:hypothetical protein